MSSQDRIQSLDALVSILEPLRQAGQKIVTTNGVYDFLHVGHLEYLEQARALGDVLVVALNTDASVRRIKGPTRPVNPEQDRARILAGLRCVDYVTFFDEETPAAVLAQIRPHIHVKGGDYDIEAMPETQIVRAHGGVVQTLPFLPGYSNSAQFARILQAARAEEKDAPARPDWLAGA